MKFRTFQAKKSGQIKAFLTDYNDWVKPFLTNEKYNSLGWMNSDDFWEKWFNQNFEFKHFSISFNQSGGCRVRDTRCSRKTTFFASGGTWNRYFYVMCLWLADSFQDIFQELVYTWIHTEGGHITKEMLSLLDDGQRVYYDSSDNLYELIYLQKENGKVVFHINYHKIDSLTQIENIMGLIGLTLEKVVNLPKYDAFVILPKKQLAF